MKGIHFLRENCIQKVVFAKNDCPILFLLQELMILQKDLSNDKWQDDKLQATAKQIKANKFEKTEIGNSLFKWEKTHRINEAIYFIYSDASEWKSMQDFYNEVEFKFQVPHSIYNNDPDYDHVLHIENVDCANDVLRDLRWIKKNSIVWLIKDLITFPDFDKLADLFSSFVLPFWEGNDSLNSVVNVDSVLPPNLRRKPRHFNVYYS